MVETWPKRALRWAVLLLILGLAAAPPMPLVWRVAHTPSDQPLWTPAFASALTNGLLVGAGVASISLTVGASLGLLTALYRFPGRRGLALFQVLPLLFPSFLPAIGWSNLAGFGWLPRSMAPSGTLGTILILGLQAVPLPFFATWAACRNLTASQIEVARLHGGEKTVILLAERACFGTGLLTALLAGILCLSDPGAPLILGCRTAAVEITTSFSALFDFELAAKQCLALAIVVLALTCLPLAFGLRNLASAVLARQTRPLTPYPHSGLAAVAGCGLAGTAVFGVGLPLAGLCLPIVGNPMVGRAVRTVTTTLGPTTLYCGGAAVVAAALGLALAMTTRTGAKRRLLVVGALLVLLTLPPALGALGLVYSTSATPRSLDFLLRGDLVVALALGLRFLPVATLALMRSLGSLSPSWLDAARLHGIPGPLFFRRVTFPLILPGIGVAILLVAVLSAADITTTLLLEPPGRQTLPVAIFTIMANSPEGLVASVCLAYVLVVLALLIGGVCVCRWRERTAG